jgi:hypothetical protein
MCAPADGGDGRGPKLSPGGSKILTKLSPQGAVPPIMQSENLLIIPVSCLRFLPRKEVKTFSYIRDVSSLEYLSFLQSFGKVVYLPPSLLATQLPAFIRPAC